MAAYYTVAYPHPSIPPENCILPCEVDAKYPTERFLNQLVAVHPEHADDLKAAILWKPSGLSLSVVYNEPREQMWEWIRETGERLRIMTYKSVGEYFPDGPQGPSGGWVDIMVITPEILEDMEYQGDPDGNLKRMKMRLKLSRTLGGITSPTDCVKNPDNLEATVLAPGGPRYGRPSDRYGPPTALFDKALAVLHYDLEHLETLTPLGSTVYSAFDLISSSTRFFSDKETREETLRDTLEALLPEWGRRQEPMVNGAVKPSGVWLEGFFVYMILEIKNEPGLGGDPFLQNLAAYGKIVKQEQYSKFCLQSNLPVVLLSMTGNRLEVATAIFTEAVYADKLLSFYLHLGPHGPDNVLRVARIFTAIRKCAGELRTLYGRLKNSSVILFSVMYPNPTADPPESPIPQLEFFCKMDRAEGIPIKGAIDADNERHAIYLAKMKSNPSASDSSTRDVLVKFAAKYNEAAHMLLASQDPPLAPTLYSCTRVVGGLYMVVMEYLSDAKPLHHFFYPSYLLSPPTAEVIRRDLTKALDLLGGKDFVFGDLRQMNVLYSPKDDHAYLVDFDGVGKHGEDRYSPCLNPEAGLGVERWQIMEKKHDRENLERVMEWLSEGLSFISQ